MAKNPPVFAPEPEPLVGVQDVMKMLGVGKNYVYELAASGELRSYRFGHRVRFRLSDVDAWLKDHERRD
jgi:excisionase family DNA binding protein